MPGILSEGRCLPLHPFDDRFFEAYKSLDRLCADLYGDWDANRTGVTAYINDMDSRTPRGRQLVPAWDADFRSLKHVRDVRNQIAHEAGNARIAQQPDLDFVEDLHQRLLSGTDPLTSLRKAEKRQTEQRKRPPSQAAPNRTAPSRATPPRPSRGSRREPPPRQVDLASPVFAVVFLIMALLIILMLKM